LVFLREGGDGGLRRWSLLTPLVEAPTGNIISSSLNGFSLRVFSGSGLLELDIFAVRERVFLKVYLFAGCSKGSQRRGARKIDGRRRTMPVRRSEAIERNENL
jgi:hypothetical protein